MECPQNIIEIITVGASATVILGAIFTTFAFLFKEIKGVEVKLSAEIKEQAVRTDQLVAEIRMDIKEQSLRTDQLVAEIRTDIKEQSVRTDQLVAVQAARSDQLYTMFIDLLKDLRSPT